MMKMVIGDELAEWRMEGDTSSGASGHLPQRGTLGSAGYEGIAPTGGAAAAREQATGDRQRLNGGAGDEGIAPTGGAATGFINSQFPEGSKVIRRAVLHFGPRRQMVKAM